MITLYSKPNCVFCSRAKRLLESNGIQFSEFEIGRDVTREYVLTNFPESKTVPIILVNGTNIGGYDQLVEKINEEGQNFGKRMLLG